ncbi:MAG: PAS domain S-box protein [Anaerolineae bacterium]|nr:PAS domain S-box protein [Anaerolineae bacterium]
MNAKPIILVLDDEINIRNLVTETLSRHYCEVLTASSSEDALVVLQSNEQIMVILLDMLIPGSGGFEFIDVLKHNSKLKLIKVIMLVPLYDEQVIGKAFEIGVDDYLCKPFNKGELVARVKAQIALKQTKDVLNQLDRENTRLYQQAKQESFERKKLEELLGESEARCQILADNVSDLIAKLSPKGVFTYVSPTYRTVLGYESVDMCGCSFYEYIHPEDLEQIKDLSPPLLTSLVDKFFTLRFYHKNDIYIWLELNLQGIYHPETRCIQELIVVARNITEYSVSETTVHDASNELEKLYQSPTTETKEPLKRRIIDSNQSEIHNYEQFEDARAMYVITRNKDDVPIVVNCNELFLRTLGYTRQLVIGKPLSDFYSSKTVLDVLDNDYRPILDGNSMSMEQTFLANDGRVINTLLITKPDLDAEGNVIGWQSLYINITKRKQIEIENARLYEQAQQEIMKHKHVASELEKKLAILKNLVVERTEELNIANVEVARADRLKDEFLANISHELRTPLNAILGISEGMLEEIGGPLSDSQRRFLTSIKESGQNLLSSINDILDMSRIEAGKMYLDIGPVSIVSVGQASLRLIKQSAHKKQIKIFSHFDNNINTVQADNRRLKQILVNMLSNAIKFTPEYGKIGLNIIGDPQEQIIHFMVWDTGIGISPEQIPELFKPFVQLDSRLSRQYSGTGLGLVLIQRIAEMHGGSVSVESQVGQGSRFTVSLPWHNEKVEMQL